MSELIRLPDSILERFHLPENTTFFGKPIHDLYRDSLLACIQHLHVDKQETVRRHKQSSELMADIRVAKSRF